MINSRFKIIKKLGEGRSSVYQCVDIKNGYEYAIKIISPLLSDDEYASFSDEYNTIKKLNHPGIIKGYESGTVLESEDENILKDSRYILLEYFNGTELSCAKNIPETELRKIIIHVASVLQYLHMSKFIYFDLKPENILTDGNSIKLIDFGFTQIDSGGAAGTRGTAEYIAPELLKKDDFDYRVDYYSLGIMLYKLIYGSFPFSSSSELVIYKEQVEKEFSFPENNYSAEVNGVLKKLLQKDPVLRYRNSMQIYSDLNYSPAEEIISSWVPSKNFSGRKDVLNILSSYLVNYSGGDIFNIKGAEGSGKTAVITRFAELNEGAIFLDSSKTLYGIDFIKEFISKLLYNEKIYPCISNDLIKRIKNFLISPPGNIIEETRGIISQLIKKCRFILLVDDFNFLDELSLAVFREIIPLLQVNNIKIVLTENSDKASFSAFILNQHQVNLHPFTENQLQEYLDSSFYSEYPKEELRKLTMMYADMLPGSIDSFIRDLVLAGILKFSPDDIYIDFDERSSELLKQFHEHIYKMRVGRLADREKSLAQVLSSFDTLPDRKILSEFFESETELLLTNLKNKNIIHFSGNLNQVSFTSAGMKQYIYLTIKDKKDIHTRNAVLLEKITPQQRKEIAFQYESAEDFEKSLGYYLLLYDEAEKSNAYSYQKTILQHVIEFPLPDETLNKIKFELSRAMYKSGDSLPALEIINELLLYVSDPELLNEILLLKGLCLISGGNPEEGIRQVEYLVDIMDEGIRKNELQSEIASAYIDLNEFSKAESICLEIRNNKFAGPDTTAKCHNLLGLISIHRDNDFDKAYDFFQEGEIIYANAGMKFGVAQMLLNLANIKLMRGESEEAEKLWRRSLEINTSVGNLKHEAILLLNFGVLYFETLDYEKSVEFYKRALSIFTYTGDPKREGLVNINLAEIYFLSCEYKNAYKYVTEAKSIFQKLQDTNEELESLFLAGKIFIILGSDAGLQKVLNDFESLLKIELGEKHSYNYRFLKTLSQKNSLNFFHEINDIINYYNRQGDKSNMFLASIAAVRFLYEHQLYKEALEQINDSGLIVAAKANDIYWAEWNLYFGLIIEKTGNPDHQPGEYFLKAYNLIENLSICELTWRTMAALAGFYQSRGNLLKAEEFAYYADSLIEHISASIWNDELKKSYLGRKELKEALYLCRNILKGHG